MILIHMESVNAVSGFFAPILKPPLPLQQAVMGQCAPYPAPNNGLLHRAGPTST